MADLPQVHPTISTTLESCPSTDSAEQSEIPNRPLAKEVVAEPLPAAEIRELKGVLAQKLRDVIFQHIITIWLLFLLTFAPVLVLIGAAVMGGNLGGNFIRDFMQTWFGAVVALAGTAVAWYYRGTKGTPNGKSTRQSRN